METPRQIISELAAIRSQSEKGIELLAAAEKKMIELELEEQRIELSTFIGTSGTVADKTAISKLAALEKRQEAAIARAEVSRIKTKISHLKDSQMAVMSAAKMVELEWKG